MNTQETKVYLTSKSDLWNTPSEFFKRVEKILNIKFNLDPCSPEPNNLGIKKYFTKKDDGLSQSWSGYSAWVNPPYSKIKDWAKKCVAESDNANIVMLVPARTDTRWWNDYALKADKIIFIKGRLKFSGSKNSATFPSALIIFNKKFHTPQIEWIDRY